MRRDIVDHTGEFMFKLQADKAPIIHRPRARIIKFREIRRRWNSLFPRAESALQSEIVEANRTEDAPGGIVIRLMGKAIVVGGLIEVLKEEVRRPLAVVPGTGE